METKLATEIAPGRVVYIGKGAVSYRVESINWARATADLVSQNAINVTLHKTVELSRLNIAFFAPENQVPVETLADSDGLDRTSPGTLGYENEEDSALAEDEAPSLDAEEPSRPAILQSVQKSMARVEQVKALRDASTVGLYGYGLAKDGAKIEFMTLQSAIRMVDFLHTAGYELVKK